MGEDLQNGKISLELPEFYNFAGQVDRYAAEHPQKTALMIMDDSGKITSFTYLQLMKFANQIGNAMLSLGIDRGDKVIVLVPRGVEAYGIYLGLTKMGAVVMPGSEMLRGKDIEYRANHAEAKAILALGKITEEVDIVRKNFTTVEHCVSIGGQREGWISFENIINQASEQLEACNSRSDELAFLAYTSGTTGGPKGVMHVHGWPYAHLAVAATYWLDVREDDVVWATAGPGWAKWVWSPFVSVLGKGATAFVFQGKFDPLNYLKLLSEQPITVLCATPTEYRLMAKVNGIENFNLQTLRSATSAGEPLNREVIDTFKRVFDITVRDGYGQTENTLLVGTFVGVEPKPGSMGKPSPVVKVAIIDESGIQLPVGEVGDIAIDRGMIALFRGYLNDSERTKRAFRGNWYVTGDQGRMDEDGYIWFEGRADDIIISAGYTIGPFEVEDALVKHAAVAECAAVASPDPDRGHIVKAFVVLKNGYEPSQDLIEVLQEHTRQLTAPYKYPRKIEFVADLPKTASGKIRRIELRNT